MEEIDIEISQKKINKNKKNTKNYRDSKNKIIFYA